MDYLYYEPIKGDVYRFAVEGVTDDYVIINPRYNTILLPVCLIPNKVYKDSYYECKGHRFWIETEVWKVRYQNSMSLRVSQDSVRVYFVYAMKRGKVNTRAMVIDDWGLSYSTFVPTLPMPRFGESLSRLRMDLDIVSLVPAMDILEKVVKVRESDATLV